MVQHEEKNFCGKSGSLEKSTNMKESLDKCEALLRISKPKIGFYQKGKKKKKAKM